MSPCFNYRLTTPPHTADKPPDLILWNLIPFFKKSLSSRGGHPGAVVENRPRMPSSGQNRPRLPSLEGNLGRFAPVCPSEEGNLGQPPALGKKEGGNAPVCPPRICRHFRLVSCGLRLFCRISGKLDLSRVDLVFFAGILDLSRVDLDFFLDLYQIVVLIMRLTNLYDLKVQAHDHKAKTSRFQSRHHPMKGSHVHRMQRRFLLITGTGKV